MKLQTLFVLALVSGCIATAGSYFQLEEGSPRCFIEEVPRDTLIVGKCKAEGLATPDGEPRGIRLTAKDPSEATVIDMDLRMPEDTFSFTSHVGGEHQFCFQPNTSHWFGHRTPIKFYLNIETGEAANDYKDAVEKEHISALELRIRRLSNRLRDIRAEQNYQRGREEVFRNTSESTNARVMWWSIIQTAILALCGLWQITHLKGFFKAKGLVKQY
ncbi:hypothetical protein PROFUN_01892 [Planoprotostelium fungivorum]|uniref:GOLD domain-containing protein n=1 Tax=Planoprotostelium fungivorum TaxID=1890364 RepID=A0A2P6NZ00_9EUKA|nr:hypothetical protein PROFUN_01892 [Planoprotostelium fungivorum]